MYERFKSLAVALLRVPPQPVAPAGAPDSLRTFRAAPNFYRLRLARWAFSQVMAVIGLVTAIVALRNAPVSEWTGRHSGMEPVMLLIMGLEALGVVGFVVQLPFTAMLVRLDFDFRWYLVTDRSLRIRSGVWTVEELTMTFANIQELTVHQGPLQRMLGIADLKVRSAGGGGAATTDGTTVRESHVAYFHGVDNAAAIRDLILAHLRHRNDTGLGDPDTVTHAATHGSPAADGTGFDAANEVLAEARALRRVLT